MAGSFTRRNRPAGADSFRFTARIGGRAGPGAYRLSGVPTDAARNAAAPSARFTVVRW